MTVELVLQVPCILPLNSFFNHAWAPVANCPILLSNKKCSHKTFASGYGRLAKTVSSNFGLPSLVYSSGFQLCLSINLAAMWCLELGLKVTVFSL